MEHDKAKIKKLIKIDFICCEIQLNHTLQAEIEDLSPESLRVTDSALELLIRADGRMSELISIPAGGTRTPISHEAIDRKLHLIHMKGTFFMFISLRNPPQLCSGGNKKSVAITGSRCQAEAKHNTQSIE